MNRVVVFLDWQNVYKSARECFHATGTRTPQCGQIDPLKLAEHLAGRIPDGALKQVRIYRGMPSNHHSPKDYGATRRQTAAWMAVDPKRVWVYLRPLQYLPDLPPREKGIDVQLALDFALLAHRGEYDIGIVFSADTDLSPALDAVYECNGRELPHPRTASWAGDNRRPITAVTRGYDVPCLHVEQRDYELIRDHRNYARKR